MKPLRAAIAANQPILSNADVKTIFSPIEQIAIVNSAFLEDLIEVAKTWSIDSRIGGLFQKHVRFPSLKHFFLFFFLSLLDFQY